MCGQTFSTKSGIIQTNNHTNYSNKIIHVNIIKAYIIDMSIQE
jgi:hypothetical protein